MHIFSSSKNKDTKQIEGSLQRNSKRSSLTRIELGNEIKECNNRLNLELQNINNLSQKYDLSYK